LITGHPKRVQYSHTKPATLYLLSIVTPPICLNQKLAAESAARHMFMAGKEEIPTNNGAVLNMPQIIRAVMSSIAEAELRALFINDKTAVSMRRTLKELGHPQTQTPIQTDNSTLLPPSPSTMSRPTTKQAPPSLRAGGT
jgi:hypothetical protein